MVQQPFQQIGRTKRGGSSAEIAGPDGFAAEVVAPGLHFAMHGLDKRGQTPCSDLSEEVAIGTDAFAEGNMEINSGHIYQSYKNNRHKERFSK